MPEYTLMELSSLENKFRLNAREEIIIRSLLNKVMGSLFREFWIQE